jgi:hypothetical protein
MMTARPAALNPAAMMSRAAINMAGPVVIAHRTVGPLMAIPVAIATGTPAQPVIGRPMVGLMGIDIVMTGHAAIDLMGIDHAMIDHAATGTGMTGLNTVAQKMVARKTDVRNGVVMALPRMAAGSMITVRKMDARPGVARRKVAPGLAAVAI